MAYRMLYLVRHGHYRSWDNHKDELEGALTRFGEQQAQLTAAHLAGLPLTAIHCSDLRRAVQTCAPIAAQHPGIEVQYSNILRECVPGIPSLFAHYFQDYDQDKIKTDTQQAEAAFSQLFTPAQSANDQHELVVAHGNLIRYLLCRALGVDPLAWGYLFIDNCSLTQVLVRADGTLRILGHNRVGHLPPELVGSYVQGGLSGSLFAEAQQLLAAGDPEQARAYAREAQYILQALDHPTADKIESWVEALPKPPEKNEETHS